MELIGPIANTRRLPRCIDLGRSVGVVFTTVVALLIISGIGFYVALRSDTVPSFDTHLTLDGRHALVIQNDMPCVPEEPPQRECGNAGGRREFKVLYSTLENDKVLFAVELPER